MSSKRRKTFDDTNPSRQFRNWLSNNLPCPKNAEQLGAKSEKLPPSSSADQFEAAVDEFPHSSDSHTANREFDSRYLVQCLESLIISDENDAEEMDNEDESVESNAARPSMESLDDELLFLFLLYNLSHRAMQFLLNALHSRGLPVSKSLYFLTKDGKESVQKYSMGVGHFVYFQGIASNIGFILRNNLLRLNNSILLPESLQGIELDIKIGIDGMPVYQSSNYSAWPILALISGFDRPVPVA